MNPLILKILLGVGFTLTGVALLGSTKGKPTKPAEKVNDPKPAPVIPPKEEPKPEPESVEPPPGEPAPADSPEKEVDPDKVIEDN